MRSTHHHPYRGETGVHPILTQLLPGGGSEVVVECRHCGTTVSSKAEECPDCGGSEICRYEIPE
ncbi:hypothetical protein EAF64_14730 [Halorientalis pallida]|uniref:Small CPxCG-related zinc finger protein n=1 Tax=Halorientalis pallida TaxID=2479928 RepID=A0A498KZB4_9EURY|nr:hypothetical protein EAF64_14730 [Halorientalis pallida]